MVVSAVCGFLIVQEIQKRADERVAALGLEAPTARWPTVPLTATPPPSSPAAPTIPVSPTETKICPQCAEQVKRAARICRFCRYEFTEADDAPLEAALDDEPPKVGRFRFDEAPWRELLGKEGTLHGKADRLVVDVGGHQDFALVASEMQARTEAGGLVFDDQRGVRLRIVPLEGQNARTTLAALGFERVG